MIQKITLSMLSYHKFFIKSTAFYEFTMFYFHKTKIFFQQILDKTIILYYNNGNRRDIMEKIGDRILCLLKQSGYSQKELALMVGVTEAAMCRYLKNEREPKIEVVANLATALNTTVDYLISGRSESNSFDEIYHLVSRSTVTMSSEEKMKLMKLLLDK
jgi:transcriptional regulator with XRE-family HTH domain